jgi:hypothetical protein
MKDTQILKNKKLIEKGEYYEVYDFSIEDDWKYQYYIFDNERTIIEAYATHQFEPKISEYENVIKIEVYSGPGMRAVHFVDINTMNSTKISYFVFANTNQLYAYIEPSSMNIVIEDIFTSKEIKRTAVDLYAPLGTDFEITGKFLEKGKYLKIEYLNSKQERVTDTLLISEE